MAAVHGEVRHVARRAEADEDPLAAPFGRNLDILDVVADAAVVVVVAAERVAVPSVRQVHHRGVVAGVAVAEKAPVAVDVDHFARPGLQGAPCEQRTQQQGEDQGSVFHRKSHRERYFNVPAAGFVPQFGGTGRSFLYAGRSPGYSARWIGPAGCLRRSVRSAYRSTPPGPQAAGWHACRRIGLLREPSGTAGRFVYKNSEKKINRYIRIKNCTGIDRGRGVRVPKT